MNEMTSLVLALVCCWTVTVRCLPQIDSLASLRGVPPGFPEQTTSRQVSPGPPHRLLHPVPLYPHSSLESSQQPLDINDNTIVGYPPYDASLRQRLQPGLDRPSTLQLYSHSKEDFSDFVPLSILQSHMPSGTRNGNKPIKLVDSPDPKDNHLYVLFNKYDDNNIDSVFVEGGQAAPHLRQTRRDPDRHSNEEGLTFSLLLQPPNLRAPYSSSLSSRWNRLSSIESESRETPSIGTLTAALAARQGGINVNSATVDQILGLPEQTVRAVFGRSKKDIVERLLGIDSSEDFSLNELRSNPALLRSLRGMSLARALSILRQDDDDDYDHLRLHHLHGGHNHLGGGLYPHRYRNDPYYDDRFNSIDDDSYSLGSFLPLTGAATINNSSLFTFVVILLQMIIFK